jgi:hypothetical protein
VGALAERKLRSGIGLVERSQLIAEDAGGGNDGARADNVRAAGFDILQLNAAETTILV